MAASTPMSDDWEMVFIDEDGELVSSKAPAAQRKDVNPVIEPAPLPQSKPEVVPTESQASFLSKLANMQPKESTEKETAWRSLLARRPVQPVPGSSITSLAYNDPRLSSSKQFDQRPRFWSFFPSQPSEPWKADESATKADSKVDQGLAQYNKETKASPAEQLMNSQGHSAQIGGPSV